MESFLCDSAKSCISGLSLSSANYFEAIELLKQSYGNPQMLINAYMKRFVQLPVIKNYNDVFGLGKLYDQVESSIRNLKSLQMDTSGYGALLVPLLIENFHLIYDKVSQKSLKMTFGNYRKCSKS